MARDGWAGLVAVARRQHGVLSLEQAAACGVSQATVRWRCERGEVRRIFNAVYAFASHRETWDQRAVAAAIRFGPRGSLSHATAASLFGFDGFSTKPPSIEITVPRDLVNAARIADAPSWLSIHRTQNPVRATKLGLLGVTDLSHTLLDLAAALKDDALDDALDSAQRMYPFLDTELLWYLESLPFRHPGTNRLKSLMDERGGLATESPLEAKVFRVLRRTRLPRPRFQFQLFDDGGYVGRPDFAWPQHRVALHADGYKYHQGRIVFERDRVAFNRLAALGYHSIFVTSRTVDDTSWLEALRTVLAQRAPQLSLPLNS